MKQSASSASALMTTVRILNIIYVAQAGAGIVFGIAYAVWRMYLA
jgi:multidrug transporter EmrE-like cation transporter